MFLTKLLGQPCVTLMRNRQQSKWASQCLFMLRTVTKPLELFLKLYIHKVFTQKAKSYKWHEKNAV